MVRIVHKYGGGEYFQFQIVKDSIKEIVRMPIYVHIKSSDRYKREKEVISNIKRTKPSKGLMWDIAESFDCGRLSIEHLTEIHNFIFKNI